MARNIIKCIVKGIVESGTTLIVGRFTKTIADSTVPKQTGISGVCRDISVGAARYAITYRAAESMGDYVDKKYDKTAAACKNIMKTLNELGNKEEEKDGEKDADEAKSTIEHIEASGD